MIFILSQSGNETTNLSGIFVILSGSVPYLNWVKLVDIVFFSVERSVPFAIDSAAVVRHLFSCAALVAKFDQVW